MEETIVFSKQYEYDTLKIGITVPVQLTLGDEIVFFEAKVDTGASNCIFERVHGERLGLVIESGEKQDFSTTTGNFTTFAHEMRFSVLGIETFSTVYFAESRYYTRNVLGRQGWLDRVKLGLIDYEGKLFLSEHGE
ncbi:MAG: hypothetical protein R2747_07110 [Pyrinomonadaceae bacterium]